MLAEATRLSETMSVTQQRRVTLPVTAGREVSGEDTYEGSVGDRHHSGYVLVLVYAVRETPD